LIQTEMGFMLLDAELEMNLMSTGSLCILGQPT